MGWLEPDIILYVTVLKYSPKNRLSSFIISNLSGEA